MNKNIEKKGRIGFKFFHAHPFLEKSHNLDESHVIIDRKEWKEIVEFFEYNQNLIQYIGQPGKKCIVGFDVNGNILDINTNGNN